MRNRGSGLCFFEGWTQTKDIEVGYLQPYKEVVVITLLKSITLLCRTKIILRNNLHN